MTPCTRSATVIAIIFCLALPALGQQYLLYAPQPVAPGQPVSPKDGILVQEIVIQRGDTLYKLSRKFSGHGMYFPQILLFNSIKNPDLIYPGNTLKVPVTQKEKEPHDSKRAETKPNSASPGEKKAAGTKGAVVQAKNIKVPAAKVAKGQKLFETAVKAYRQGDCRSALTLLDRYIVENPGSPLAADAILYKAECYLKLSAQ